MNQNTPIEKPKVSIFDPWLWKMAWRDSRTHRGRLMLFMSSIVLGIAALVAISSFGESLENAIDDQAKSLLGADLEIRTRNPFTETQIALFDSLGGEQARETSFGSMAYFTSNAQTRLVQVRALEGRYPFYGEIETTPAAAIEEFHTSGGALVDQGLMLQYQLTIGDSIRLGEKSFAIRGKLDKVPGAAGAGMVVAPRVYIPFADLESTGLIRFGSRVFYRKYFKFADNSGTEALAERLEKEYREERLRAVTSEERRESFGEAMGNLYRFLNLVAFIALLLGSIGVASAIHVYVKQKLSTIAVLRCVGCSIRQTFYIYLIQAAAMGIIGSIVGAILGVAIELYLPAVLKDFLVFDVEFTISFSAILKGLLLGLGITLLFALLPLIAIRKISPLLAIRASFESTDDGEEIDTLRWSLYGLIALVITLFAINQMEHWTQGILFALGLAVAFGLLAGLAKLLMYAIKRFFPRSWGYIWRQSLANLYRPNNQTLVLMLSLGLGTLLISNLFLTQENLLEQVNATDSNNQPNLILFDIQEDQREAITELITEQDMPVLQTVPIVTLRLQDIKERAVAEIRDDTTSDIPDWALMREYRVTYRDSLHDTEEVIRGEWVPEVDPMADTIAVSLEEGIARNLTVDVGDVLTIDVQGVPFITKITSIRKVDWQRVQPNFFMVFPKGIMEEAPQIHVLVTRASNPEKSAQLQRAVVESFPNVSAIDLGLVLKTVESILDKISFVIRFMAMFSIFTGITVLAAAVITTRFQRIQESVLLRTLGARRQQVSRIIALEYVYLGGLAGLTGILLSLASAWAISVFAFRIDFQVSLLPILAIWIGVVLLTLLLGMLNSRGIATRPPLEILRTEA